MSYFGELKRFNPLLGDIPNHPFSLLPQIAQRARALLKSRTAEQIDSAAKDISFSIYCHFDDLKQDEIARLLRHADEVGDHERLFEWDGGSVGNGRWLFKESMEDSLGIPTAQNTSEVDALKANESYWSEIGSESFPNCQPYELFAVLSIWMVAEAVSFIEREDDPARKMDEALGEFLKSAGVRRSYISLAASCGGECALKAMDAVCYAEHLQIVGWWEATHTRAIEDQDQERKRRSMQVNALSQARHRKTYKAMEMAIEEWEKDRSRFPSAEKAGQYLADWLTHQGFVYEPRTVTGWIRTHAKKTGIRFR